MADKHQIEARVKRRVEVSDAMLKASGIPPEYFQRCILNAFVLNPKLADCNERSIDEAIIRCINAGLLPDGKESAIVPFKGKATFIPMVEGKIKLAFKATPGLALRCKLVYKDDEFDYEEGLYPTLKHIPAMLGSKSSDDIIAVYAVARLPAAASPTFEVMMRGDIDRHMGYSPSGKNGPWGTHYGPMSEKTVISKILKRLPQIPGFAIRYEEELDHVETEGFVNTDTGEVFDHPPIDEEPPAPQLSTSLPVSRSLP